MTDETVLRLGDNFFPAGSGRAITQSLEPIDNGDLRRSVNGQLTDFTRTQNRKFQSSISVSDMSTPTLAGIWKGAILQVECIQKLRENVSPASTTHTIIRDPVAGSVIGYDEITEERVDPTIVAGRDITFTSNVVAVEYRPDLEMMVISTSKDTDEYSTEETWSIDLEEV